MIWGVACHKAVVHVELHSLHQQEALRCLCLVQLAGKNYIDPLECARQKVLPSGLLSLFVLKGSPVSNIFHGLFL